MDTLEFETAAGVINKIKEKEAEKKLWDIWLLMYQQMNADNYESFQDFKDRHMGRKPEIKYKKSKEEIMAEIQKIRKGKVVGTHGDI